MSAQLFRISPSFGAVYTGFTRAWPKNSVKTLASSFIVAGFPVPILIASPKQRLHFKAKSQNEIRLQGP